MYFLTCELFGKLFYLCNSYLGKLIKYYQPQSYRIKGLFTQTVMFSVGRDFQRRMRQKIGSILFFVRCRTRQLPPASVRVNRP
jgi:hypothetical protein